MLFQFSPLTQPAFPRVSSTQCQVYRFLRLISKGSVVMQSKLFIVLFVAMRFISTETCILLLPFYTLQNMAVLTEQLLFLPPECFLPNYLTNLQG